jgi:hypothetical protein
VDAIDSKDQAAIERSDTKFAGRYVILQEGATPSVSGRIFLLLFTLAVFGTGVYYFFKKKPAPAQT